VVQASTAELFSSWNPSANDSSHLPGNPNLAEFLALLIGSGSSQVLPLDHSLGNENHPADFSNCVDPAVADQPLLARDEG
jgi:hypothetical protein